MFVYDVFRHFGTKKTSTEKRHTPLPIHELFPYLNFSERQKRSPTKFFGTVRLNDFHGKPRISSIMHKLFGCPKLFESMEGSPQVFWYCETKTIDRIVIPLLSKKFWNKIKSETQTCSPTVFFGDVRQKKSKKLWYSYYLKIFHTRTFLEHRSVRLRCFSAFWDKKTSTEKRHTPLLIHELSPYLNFLKTKAFPHEVFRYCETKRFPRETENLLYYA